MMLIRFVQALWVWARNGFSLLPQTLIDLRWSVCQGCEHKRRGLLRTYCNACKCTISKRRHPFQKLSHPCQECPLLKWSKIYGLGCDKGEDK